MSFWDEIYARQDKAKKLVKQVTYRELEASPPHRRFEVLLKNKVIGHADLCNETIERRPRGARYVTRRWTRLSWQAQLIMGQYHGLFYRSRKKAVEAMLEDYLRKDK
jgi:hypothetical protein